MITFINNLIETILKKNLHAKRDSMISTALSRFKERYPEANEDHVNALHLRLKKEATRVYNMSDDSILEASITKASYTFWLTTILGTLFIGVLNYVTSGNYFPLVSPLIMSLFNWLIAIITIPVTYNQRVKGGMSSTISTYAEEKELDVDENTPLLEQPKPSSYYTIRSKQASPTAQNSISPPLLPAPLPNKQSSFSTSLTTFLTTAKKTKRDNSTPDWPTKADNPTESMPYSPI